MNHLNQPGSKLSVGALVGLLCLVSLGARGATTTERLYLSGKDKDAAVRWEFFCTEGRNSGFWTNILVPSNWELQGFGSYYYGSAGKEKRTPEQGKYRHSFKLPAGWGQKRIFLVFEGAMTDTEVLVNGKSAGPIHQGGFYRFKHEITDLVKPGTTNLLEVNVTKVSADPTVEDAERMADYWVFGGIYRPVYLEALPPSFVDWTAVDAKANGDFRLDVHLNDALPGATVEVRVRDAKDRAIGKPVLAPVPNGATNVTLRSSFKNVKTWSAETPNLYTFAVTLRQGKSELHQVSGRFGFRTFEVRRGEGLFLNGQRILLQGANRHSFWPDSGRCLSRKICYDDAKLIKSMNMNAVRMSHYPPDSDFLEACDELGLYVLDELAGWQRVPYDTAVGKKLVREMIIRDVNHPSILFWDNGNEGGWNRELEPDYWLYDPQRRTVLHPWESNQGVNTAHYRLYNEHLLLLEGRPVPIAKHKYVEGDLYMPTEFLHGLYDGGHGAGLQDYWLPMRSARLGAGGFLWALVDEGVVRTDQNGRIDCVGNAAPDGIVGPYREKEGSFFTIKELWSPVQVLTTNVESLAAGVLEVENQYAFINLNQCRFEWRLVNFTSPAESAPRRVIRDSGTIRGPDVKPGARGTLKLPLPRKAAAFDAVQLSAHGPNGEELWTWSWPIKPVTGLIKPFVPVKPESEVSAQVNGNVLEVTAGSLQARFDLSTGLLLGSKRGAVACSLANGPRLCPDAATNAVATVRHAEIKGGGYGIEASRGPLSWTWKVQPEGFIELDCRYTLNGTFDFHGVTFDYPETQMREKSWLGAGPYRVWKNRMQGVTFDVWHTPFNDPVPGEQWEFPEFKGYFRDFAWLKLSATEGEWTVLNDTPGLFYRIGTPQAGTKPQSTAFAFPDGQISFLHAIAPIGNKFQAPATIGPASQPNQAAGEYQIHLRFMIGEGNRGVAP